jgi:hypothetical protein
VIHSSSCIHSTFGFIHSRRFIHSVISRQPAPQAIIHGGVHSGRPQATVHGVMAQALLHGGIIVISTSPCGIA